ncbi:EAL domain-containing protein [Leptospira sp. 96542]|nr:EAL domain-containing protein [Leptospira sp. 96542]
MNPSFPEEQLVNQGGQKIPKEYSCSECRNGAGLDFSFSMAFQPIVDMDSKTVYSYEALVRGLNGEGAYQVLSLVNQSNRYQFDQACRVKAIELASKLNIKCYLNINFLPNAVYAPESCIRTTLKASKEFNFPLDKLVFEMVEGEEIQNHSHVINIFKEYKNKGFLTAIDDFGAGYSGLNLLAKFPPDIIKLDMDLIRNIDQNKIAELLVKAMVSVCAELNILVIAEGIETLEEYSVLRKLGIRYFQGYLIAKPMFEGLPEVNYLP